MVTLLVIWLPLLVNVLSLNDFQRLTLVQAALSEVVKRRYGSCLDKYIHKPAGTGKSL